MTPASQAALRAALTLCLAASVHAAHAHAGLERKEATINESYRGTVLITHGCEGKPTTRVRVTIPEGVIGAKPMPKAGWSVSTIRGAYARAYPSFHGQVSEGVQAITWTGGSLEDDQVDEFTFFARISDSFAPGDTVHFPVEQDCANGQHRWTQVPTPGQSARDLKAPAPGVRILAAQRTVAPAQGGAASTVKAGDLTVEAPWMRATPAGAKVVGGYVRITNNGREADRLVGVRIPLAGRAEVHAMTTEGGVMKMSPVEGGLVIPPGQTVALKPGGFHLMFLDLNAAPKVGEPVEGVLVFERAGTVPVTFTVAPIGAQGPGQAPAAAPAAGHQHH